MLYGRGNPGFSPLLYSVVLLAVGMIFPACCPPRLFAAVAISLFFHAGILFYFPFFQPLEIPLPEEQITRVWLIPDIAVDPALKEAAANPSIVNMSMMTETPVTEVISSGEVILKAEIQKVVKVSQADEEPLSLESTQQEEFSMAGEKMETIDLLLLSEVPLGAEDPSLGVQPEAGGAVNAAAEQLQVVQTIPLESLSPRGRLVVPPYPDQARRLGYEGRVVLELTISKAGRVIDAYVLEADAPELLINSCITTVLRRWRFISLDREVITRKTFRFRLNG